jgi:hypothetical protein
MRIGRALLISLAVVACAKSSEGTGGGDAGFVGRPDDDTDSGGPIDDFDSGSGDFDAGNNDAPSGCSNKVVINELLPEGSAVNDEFIELYNASTCDVTIDNFKLMYKSATGTPAAGAPLHTFATGTTIKSKGYYVVGTTQYTGTKNATFNGGGVTVNGGMSKDGQIALFDANGMKLDGVGYGGVTGDYIETAPAVKAAAGASLGRKTDGVDTDDNSKDFAVETKTPGAMNGI